MHAPPLLADIESRFSPAWNSLSNVVSSAGSGPALPTVKSYMIVPVAEAGSGEALPVTDRSADALPVSSTTCMHAENSDVLPEPKPLVAVAVTKLPTLTFIKLVATNGTVPGLAGQRAGRASPSAWRPRRSLRCRIARHREEVHDELAVARGGHVQRTRHGRGGPFDAALVMPGVGWRSLPPAVPPPFGVAPSPFGEPPAATRSMPTPPFTLMRLSRIETDRARDRRARPDPRCS